MGIKYAQYTTATSAPGGIMIVVEEGDAWDSEAPIVLAHPELFKDTPAKVFHGDGLRRDVEVVEQATAAPGEKRRGK